MGLLFHSDTLPLDLLLLLPLALSLGLQPLWRPLRLLDNNAPGLVCHAEALRLLGSCRQGLLLLAQPLRLLGSLALRLLRSRPQGLLFLSLGVISCNATGLRFLEETLSQELLLRAQPLRLLGSSALGQFCFVTNTCPRRRRWRRCGEACGR